MTITKWRRILEFALLDAGIKDNINEAKYLLAGALNCDQSFLIFNATYSPSEEEEAVINEWLDRRIKGEPLSRIRGQREFWSLPFQLNKDTLDPRPETELIVEIVLQCMNDFRDEPWKILDLGTGSGCLLIALLTELPNATGLGIDISDGALEMARINAKTNDVETRATFQKGNWGASLEGPFDLIVSNPPYISHQEIETLDKGVANYDPHLALDGGEDGLDAYRILAKDIRRLLNREGLAVLEFGQNQEKGVEDIMKAEGLDVLWTAKDLAGIERIIGLASPTGFEPVLPP